MRLIILALIPFLAACHSDQNEDTAILHTYSNNDSLKLANLNNEDIFILEVHYPVILEKIVRGKTLAVREIITLHEIGLSEELLTHLIKYTGSIYMLTADDVVQLQLGGVPKTVINLMIES